MGKIAKFGHAAPVALEKLGFLIIFKVFEAF
jgi:hypothetical protein